jgi:integrase
MRRPRGTGSLYQRGGTWWIRYNRNGRCFRESSNSAKRQVAANLLQKRLSEITTGTFADPKVQRVRVDELAEDFLRDYKINGKKSIDDVKARWGLHLKPFFGILRASEITSDLLNRYVDARQQEGAKNATINRELAALKRMYHIGMQGTPPKVIRIPKFPYLHEDNVRTGFLEDGAYRKLVHFCPDLWFRALVECGRTYGWRVQELLKLRVHQIDVARKVIRLEVGTTKNKGGREVVMTEAVRALLELCVTGKKTDDHVFTRENGSPVRDFRDTWWRAACSFAGLGKLTCRDCSALSNGRKCKCGSTTTRYRGLIFHDLRRTAARNLRRIGVGESVIMRVGGWKTRSVFQRYDIVDNRDIADAMLRLQETERAQKDKAQLGHNPENETFEQNAKNIN